MTPGSAWGRCGWRWLGGLGLAVWALGGPLPAAAQATGAVACAICRDTPSGSS